MEDSRRARPGNCCITKFQARTYEEFHGTFRITASCWWLRAEVRAKFRFEFIATAVSAPRLPYQGQLLTLLNLTLWSHVYSGGQPLLG